MGSQSQIQSKFGQKRKKYIWTLHELRYFFKFQKDMRFNTIVLLLTITSLVCSQIILTDSAKAILAKAPNPNNILKVVSFNPLNYAQPEVEVSISLITVGQHGIAYNQFQILYPLYQPYPISRCTYSTLGTNRYYTFTVTVGEQSKQAKTTISVEPQENITVNPTSPDTKDGYSQVSIEWAQNDPTISVALNAVIKQYWHQIKANALVACWEKQESGIWNYRFYFQNVAGNFEYNSSDNEDSNPQSSSDYYTEIQPVYSVGNSSQYAPFDLSAFKKSPAYPIICDQLTASLGNFDPSWILNVSISVNQGVNYIKVAINFQPFLLKQQYEAHYFGSVEKAALLKIDEKVFNSGDSFKNWVDVANFTSYFAFREANQYVLSQFTWLRFYTPVAAYSGLQTTGRKVRIAYQGNAGDVDPKNQINIVIFIDSCGKYYIDRNDFLATNLNSYGRNNWVSLFVSTPNVTKAQYYEKIVKFFQSIYPKFWSSQQLTDIKFKGDLHVISFQNPTNLAISHAVLNVSAASINVLNNFYWINVGNSSLLVGRLENYVLAKYNVSQIMFIQALNSNNGTHFEVSYLDKNGSFQTAYVLYIDANDVFTDDSYQFTVQTTSNSGQTDTLPANIQDSITTFFKDSCDAIISFATISPKSFAAIVLNGNTRWQIIVNWVKGKWQVASKQPYNEGYSKATGFPSSQSAAATGFLAKLYPNTFAKGYVYITIETKIVGVSLYNRHLFDFGGNCYEGVVQSTFGVGYSQILNKFSPIIYYKKRGDYGYGASYAFDYGVDSTLLYGQKASGSNLSAEPAKTVAPNAAAQVKTAKSNCPKNSYPDIFTKICLPVF